MQPTATDTQEIEEARTNMQEAYAAYDLMVERFEAGKCGLADTWGFLADAKEAERVFTALWTASLEEK